MKERHLRVDYTGMEIGDFVVEHFDETSPKYRYRWVCKCKNCGKEKSIDYGQIWKALNKDNGILKCDCNPKYRTPENIKGYKEDLTGRKFGKLTVDSFAYKKHSHSWWNCTCECGEKIIRSIGWLKKTENPMCPKCVRNSKKSINNVHCVKDVAIIDDDIFVDLDEYKNNNIFKTDKIIDKNGMPFFEHKNVSVYSILYGDKKLEYSDGNPKNLLRHNIKNNKEEQWVDINGYEGLYQVSNLGRVRSLDRIIERSNGAHQFYPGIIIDQSPTTTCKYYNVDLSKDGIVKHRLVHILVAEAFLPPKPGPEYEVDHKDNNCHNNRADNLQWLIHKDNIHKSYNTMSPVRNYRECTLVFPDGSTKDFHSITDLRRYKNENNLPFGEYGISQYGHSNGYKLTRRGIDDEQLCNIPSSLQ